MPVDPVLPLRIPGTIAIVRIPVVPDTERENPQAYRGAVIEHRNIPALVGVNDASCVNPSPVRVRHDVAPAIVAQTALDRDRDTGRQYNDWGILGRRAGAKAHIPRCIGPLRVRSRRDGSQSRRKTRYYFQVFHFRPPQLLALRP